MHICFQEIAVVALILSECQRWLPTARAVLCYVRLQLYGIAAAGAFLLWLRLVSW
jgi:hypothetical protein